MSFTVIDAMFLDVGNSKNMWIGDTGASCHMTCSDQGMYDCVDIDDPIRVGDGKVIKATKMGSKKVWVKQKNGKDFHLTIHNCKYVPDLWVNLLSITSTLASGWQISNKGLIMKISKNKDSLEFDQIYNTDIGAVVGVIMYPDTKNTNMACPVVVEETMNPDPNKGVKVSTVDINVAHKLLGHVSMDSIKRTADYYGFKLKGDFVSCADCALAKIRQKTVPKTTDIRATRHGERLFLDISYTASVSFGGAKFWVLIVDDFSRYCWSFFVPTKSG